MKAVVTVVGQDAKGIIAKVSGMCAELGANISEISQ
ncbi:MAG: ACT domain-containing protein, partial [Clostridia bacterium]|nr:ACT domain-containing protein [Clostridia bacterium]